MIKVDHVMVNRLEKLTKIEMNTKERDLLRLEIIQALDFIGRLEESDDIKPVTFTRLTVETNQLREDLAEKTLFAFFENVPEQVDDYVVFSN